MINTLKKKIYFLVIFFVLSGNVFALNLEKEIAYYRDIKKPLEEFLEDLNEFRETTPGIIFRTPSKDDSLGDETLVEFDYKSSCYYANHFMELYDFYAERLFSLLYEGVDNPFFIENEETLFIRQKIIDAIELIMDELLGWAKAYLKSEKLEKINKMSQPNIGYKGTLKLVQKIRQFVEKHETIFNRIYVHERDIIIFSESVNNDVEPKLVPALNLPILKYEDIKKYCERVLKHFDVVTAFYVEKYSMLLSEDNEKKFVKKDKKKSRLDKSTCKKKEDVVVVESSVINTDNAPPIKRRSSLLQSLSPRSRTQSLKKILIDRIDKEDLEVEVKSTETNTSVECNAEEIKPIKKRSSSTLKVLSPRGNSVSVKKTSVDAFDHRANSDSLVQPSRVKATPRSPSEEDYIPRNRTKSLTHKDTHIASIIEQLDVELKTHDKFINPMSPKKVPAVSVPLGSVDETIDKTSPVITPRDKKILKKEKKDKKEKEKQLKKEEKKKKHSVKPVDKRQSSGLYRKSNDE
ncbi:MAG: hypothetical protein Q8L85_07870 [Alphaproteobacteria bacterium]|nr:hypothetical protein [Alphaproteobacteria bacterium]